LIAGHAHSDKSAEHAARGGTRAAARQRLRRGPGQEQRRRDATRRGLRATAEKPPDNPDQRIADDIPAFVTGTLTLGISLLSNAVTLVSFIGVLWTIAPPLAIGRFRVPGYLVWSAVVYSVAGTLVAQLVGRKLIGLTFEQQRFNADFRFGLVRVREHTEQIALYRGEQQELDGLMARFASIYQNWWAVMKRTKVLNFFTIGFTQVALIFPLVVAVPGYFSGIFTLGALMQILTIFGSVQGAFSWVVSSYPDLVTWRATVKRLDGFTRSVQEARAAAAAAIFHLTPRADALRADDLEIKLPDGKLLLKQDHLVMTTGDPIAVTGPSGTGKSTLFRVLAGIWPFARGSIALPKRCMFLPQRPYMPLGTLRRAVVYPASPDEVADRDVSAALAAVGLEQLADQLEAVDDWALRLSGGEQQRLALARALILAPAWLFLDEALSAADEASAAALIALLRERLPTTQIVSITHSSALGEVHARHFLLQRRPDGSASLMPVEPFDRRTATAVDGVLAEGAAH
jgi:putative ATP-binding cassette transporter